MRKKPNIYICENCGNSFNTMPHIKNRKYCSSKCRDDYRRKLVGIKNPLYKREETNCIICGTIINVTKSVLQGKKKQYCSIECGKIARKSALRKKIKKAYGKDGARDRDKDKCVICGFNYVTAVHHIIKKKDGGTDKLTNLVTLCPNHHWMAHANLISEDCLKKYAVDFYYTPEQRQSLKSKKNIVDFRGDNQQIN